MTIIKATFDGKVFVPSEAVDLPSGTTVEISFSTKPPKDPTHSSPRPEAMTLEQRQEWETILKEIQEGEPPHETFEDYLRYRRGRS